MAYLPSTGQATSTQMIDFVGHGNNHGVGLCMAGVKGAARAGMGHEAILTKYYTSVGFTYTDDNQIIRVKDTHDGQIYPMTLHDYLCRNGEEPDNWISDNPSANQEALRTLIVAARTYALYKILYGPHKNEVPPYDIIAFGGEQAFGDIHTPIQPNTVAAVNATAGKFITYSGGNPIIAAYHGSCGGYTASYEDTWPGGSTPAYLRGVYCGFCNDSTYYNWTKSVSASDIEAAYPEIGTFYSLAVESRNGLGDWGGRVKYIVIGGSAGSVREPGYKFAKKTQISLPSAYFTYSLSNRESFNEITGLRQEDLGSQYYLPWYDSQSPGMQGNWILFGNPNGNSVSYSGEVPLRISRTLSAKETYTPTFDGVMSGPVEVASDSSKTICSQRSLYKDSFNEVMGTREEDLGTKYYFTWYDYQSLGMNGNWILIGNPSTTSSVSAQVLIGGQYMGSYTIPPGGRETPSYPGVMNGPVDIIATGKVFCSQRVLYKDSFNEVMGTRTEDLGTKYYFTWYDYQSLGMNGNWMLVGNPGSNASSANVDIYIAGTKMGSYTIEPGGRVTPTYPGVMNGPVEVRSTNGVPVFCSQRVLYKDSFNEVMGTREEDLGTKYYFTWYDGIYMKNWLLVGNPSTTATANCQVYVGGSLAGSYSISPGGRVTPTYTGVMNGPVEVRSTNGVPVFCSQRVLYQDSFNEVMGTREEDLGTKYYFTWYDGIYMKSWVLVSNAGANSANTAIQIRGAIKTDGTAGASSTAAISFSSVSGGPVELAGSGNIVPSQRLLYRGTFTETPAVRKQDLSSRYYFPWYDQQEPGMTDWISVSNPDATPTTIAIKVGGIQKASKCLISGETWTTSFSGLKEGPVEVYSTEGKKFICSQRVIYQGSYEEILGTAQEKLGTKYYFPWYDYQSFGMQCDWLMIVNCDSTTATVTIKIGPSGGGIETSADIGPGKVFYEQFPTTCNGPVEIASLGGQKLVVSQRVIYKDTFNETPGVRQESLGSRYYFPWYDHFSPGMTNWIVIANTGNATTTAISKVAGVQQRSDSISPGGTAAFTLPGLIGGPVEVYSTNSQKLVVSQRVIYKGQAQF